MESREKRVCVSAFEVEEETTNNSGDKKLEKAEILNPLGTSGKKMDLTVY